MEKIDLLIKVFERIPWMTLFLVAGGAFFAYMSFRFHVKQGNTYNVWDMLMSKGKADLYKHVTVVMAALTVWTVVWLVQKDKNVETLLLGALGIFVGSRLVSSVAETVKGTQAGETSESTETTVTTLTQTSVEPQKDTPK